MSDTPQKLIVYCFTKEELELLQSNAEFIEATKNLDSIETASRAVTLGKKLLMRLTPASTDSAMFTQARPAARSSGLFKTA